MKTETEVRIELESCKAVYEKLTDMGFGSKKSRDVCKEIISTLSWVLSDE